MCLVSGINLCALNYSVDTEESFSTVAIPRKIDHLTRVASQRHMGKLDHQAGKPYRIES